MEILKKARNLALCGLVGGASCLSLGAICNVLLNEDASDLKNTIEGLKKEQEALVDQKEPLQIKIGERCFALLDPIFEGGMGFNTAVADLAMNPDRTVCGKTEDEVEAAVYEVSELEADIAAKSNEIKDATTELQITESDWDNLSDFGIVGAVGGAALYVLSVKLQRSLER